MAAVWSELSAEIPGNTSFVGLKKKIDAE